MINISGYKRAKCQNEMPITAPAQRWNIIPLIPYKARLLNKTTPPKSSNNIVRQPKKMKIPGYTNKEWPKGPPNIKLYCIIASQWMSNLDLTLSILRSLLENTLKVYNTG